MAKILYFDCFAGAAGDMVLGALIDAGVPVSEVEKALGSLMIPGYRITADRVLRSGLSAVKFRLHEEGGHDHSHDHPHTHPHEHAGGERHTHAHEHHHAHPHDHAHAEHDHGHAHDDHAHPHDSRPSPGPTPHHDHRSLAEILSLIDGSSLSPKARARAGELFQKLAEAEAAVHQMPVARVHLHEVGALDSIIDIVGSVFALEWLNVDRFVASPLNVGGGMVKSAHGVFPVPAPATLRLLGDAPVYSSGVQMETVTPTGALLVTGYATEYGPMPAMRVKAVGYGAGDRDLPGTPNVFRVVLGEDGAGHGDRVVMLECEIDDMNPQIFGVLMDRLYAAGALEVFYAPVQMKKNRPGTLLTVIASPERRDDLMGIVFRESTTIGLRYQDVHRACLEREIVPVETPLGTVRFKVARRGGEVFNASPEFEDCARLAAERSLPVKDVQARAVIAYWERHRR